MLLAVKTPSVIGAFRSVLCHSLTVVYYHVQKIDLRLPNLWTKIFTGNVDFWRAEKTGLLEKKKKELPKQGREPTVNSALKTRHLWALNPGRHFKCITTEIWGRACEIKPTNQPLISYLILFVMIYHIFCAFYCLKYPFKYRQTPLYGHPLNLLSPNIQVQILQSDLHTFPLRISWENLMKDQGIFSLVIILLILLTLSLENVRTFCFGPG